MAYKVICYNKNTRKVEKKRKSKKFYEALRWFYEESYEKKEYIEVKLKYAFSTISKEFVCESEEYYKVLIQLTKEKEKNT